MKRSTAVIDKREVALEFSAGRQVDFSLLILRCRLNDGAKIARRSKRNHSLAFPRRKWRWRL